MRKTILLSLMLAICAVLALAQSVRVSTVYNYPLLTGAPMDSVLNGLKSIRGCGFHSDAEGDGKSAIAVTNYNDLGRAHVFATIGNDSVQLVWTSPRVPSGGGGSTPRYVLFGDLDNDGRIEVIFQSQNNGVYIFEHDGVPGSHNYGTAPSQLIGSTFFAGTAGFAEALEVLDIDGDGSNELLVAYRPGTTTQQGYYVISAVGEWSTGDPGFSSFSVEFAGLRPNLTPWGLGGGSVWAMISAQLDGSGNKEVILHAFDRKTVSPMRVPSADTYQLADTTSGQAFIRLGGTFDYVARFGGLAYDIDGDGREEVYLPTTADAFGPEFGIVHMISYDPGQSTSVIDSTNVTVFDLRSSIDTISFFGYGHGDIDGNSKPNLYFTSGYPYNVASLEFQGGDKRNPANWIASIVYAGETDIYTTVSYIDSLGVLDTVGSVQEAFASKIYARSTDFDADGLEDIVLPYQILNDSTTVHNLTWNVGSGMYDTVTTVIANPKRWGLRIIERDMGTGVRGKDVTIILPEHYKLGQNYPNPFNPTTTINYTLPIATKISLKVYDVLGKEVKTLINGELKESGESAITWNGTNNQGVQVVSGTYFYTLTFGNFSKTNKMMLLR